MNFSINEYLVIIVMTTITIFYFLYEKKHEDTSPCTGSRVTANYERIAACAGTMFRSRASESQGNSATRYYAECPNHSAKTRSSKMD